ncbi:RibD family protein [Nodularia spumigena]|jgi:5-amino-6-(5-phosphoribosylamino)uracil reductase|uniref:RibD family protein n=1 Tax=Nodularia spumigena UHCC 0060 TaxID=3110300 RepID=A0ABU5UN01_NODSP|nr:RibD family protein [Nodularia spumigena]MEA5525885.1 RibD family protein [Nodularia spumigena UHCC 0143]MEA5555218.1 RibD family protein [Nodularia spumigena CH309]MEA5607648.1 RibD family protein [Nodularia spumigena UHCC 0060]MEA5615081.1 RibD family protein [Nodularia spumigena UHCC 0040]
MMHNRPHTTVVLAMSADGKIADFRRSPARFGSGADKAHLEEQIAASDAVLIGAGTLRAYGTTLTVSQPILLQHRIKRGKPAQPVHIVITQSADINPEIKFFQQPIERWLLTTTMGAGSWQRREQTLHSTGLTPARECPPKFEQMIIFDTPTGKVDTSAALQHLASLHITRLAILGGGELVASMLQLDLIDELWLTVCPLILGGASAPTPVEGVGFLSQFAPKLELLEVHQVEQEVFLHYRLQR